MDFFRTVFSDDPDPPKSKPEVAGASPLIEKLEDSDDSSSSDAQTSTAVVNPNFGGGWSFGGLIKTISTKSESVLETYRRDLKEFGSGLKKEIEVAQGSLENVSHVIDEFGNSVLKGTVEMISHGKEAILAIDHESDSSDNNSSNPNFSNQKSFNSKRYSRFDAQIRAIQGDVNTYCEEPEDLDDYSKWKLGFVLEEKDEEIENLLDDNENIESIYKRVVPNSVDQEIFWSRYFYKVHKLKQAEDLRVKLVKRAISSEEEDLSWDVDDDNDDDDVGIDEKGKEGHVVSKWDELGKREVDEKDCTNVKVEEPKVVSSGNAMEMKEKSVNMESIGVDGGHSGSSEQTVKDNVVAEPQGGSNVTVDVGKEKNIKEVDNVGKNIVVESSSGSVSDEKVDSEKSSGADKEDSVLKSDEKVASEGNTSKDSDFSVVLSQPSFQEEEDLGWDEIEDLSCIDEKKETQGGSPNRAELRKRLSAAEEEEDLSWDIEDDDEPVKA